MIKIKLQDVMWQRRIRNISELSRAAGISRQTIDALYNRPDQIKGIQFDTLDKLCQTIGCRVEELIEFVSDEYTTDLKIEMVHEGDPDYAVFDERAKESSVPLEDCDELFERIDQIRRQRDRQD